MGMYTEMRLSCRLKKETPKQVIDVLRYLADGDTMKPPSFAVPDHPLFVCRRWTCLMRMSSAYFADNPSAAVVLWQGQWHVLSVANLKNYDGEIEKFIDWLRPHIDAIPGEVWVEHQYEENDEATKIAA